jgi:hypothetical protein
VGEEGRTAAEEGAMNEAQILRVIDRVTSGPQWDSQRLQRLFDRYNERFFGGRLVGWTVVPFSGKVKGAIGHCHGQCVDEMKQIRICGTYHESDREVRATLVHEMAHAVTSGEHEDEWPAEMKRLRRAGAPTDPLDFIVPYRDKATVEEFVQAARTGVSWKKAFDRIFFEEPSMELAKQCRRFFLRAERKRKRRMSHAA